MSKERKVITKLHTKATISFAELVRPNGYWPQPYSIEQAFQVFRWLIKTGKPFSMPHKYGVYDMLCGHGSRGKTDLHYTPIASLEQLRQLFHWAILARPNGPKSVEWRDKENITFGGIRVLHFDYYSPFTGVPFLGATLSEADIETLLQLYFSASGKLVEQLNSCHKKAVNIMSNVIRVDTHSFEFVFDLEYGYDGSHWWHTLATGINFIDTFASAIVEFGRVSNQYLMESVRR